MAPKISVVIPAYNAAEDIKRAMESVQAQTFKGDIEILVVDDCSTDNTREVVESYARQDPRIKLLRHPENSNPSVARNTGLHAATGEYVAFLDSDDLWKPEHLKRLLENLEKRPASEKWAAICHYDNVSKITGRAGPPFAPTDGPQLARDIFDGTAFNLGSILMVRRDLITKEDLFFDLVMSPAEDVDWLMRFILKGGQFSILPEKLTVYMAQPGKLYPNFQQMQARIHAKHGHAVLEKYGKAAYRRFEFGIEKHVIAGQRSQGKHVQALFRFAKLSLKSPTTAIKIADWFIRRRVAFRRGSKPGSDPS